MYTKNINWQNVSNKQRHIYCFHGYSSYSVNRSDIWAELKSKKVPGKLITAIDNVKSNVKGRVRLNGMESNRFVWNKGLKQEDYSI